MDAHLYTEGSIYYYENRTNTKKDYSDPTKNHDFIVSRPVYIVDSNPVPFEPFTVNVCIITSSSNRIGIPINLDGNKEGRLLPYAIYSVHREYLTRYIGQVSPEMRSEIKEAIAYHLGFSDVEPPYIDHYQQETKELKEFENSLSPMEKTVMQFLEKKCLFKPNYYADSLELWSLYDKRMLNKDVRYHRLSDFTRAITKMQKIYKHIQVEKLRDRVKFIGFSINGDVHRVDDSPEQIEGVSVSNPDPEELDILSMTQRELYKSLPQAQKAIYDRLDEIAKYQNYKKPTDAISIDVPDHHTARIMKRLIEFDVNEALKSIQIQLESGRSPYELSVSKQYILTHLSDRDLERWIKPKYRKKGVQKVKKELRQQLGYLFQRKS